MSLLFKLFVLKLSAVFFFSENYVTSFEILGIFQTAARSHNVIFDVLMVELANRGHNVTVFTQFPKSRSIHRYRHVDLKNCFPSGEKYVLDETVRFSNPVSCVNWIMNFNPSYETIMKCEPIVRLFNSPNNYDLLITETFRYDFYQLLGHRFGIPVIAFHTNFPFPWMSEWTGLPLNPSFTSVFLSSHLPRMNFRERVINTLLYVYFIVKYKFSSDYVYDEIASKIFGPSIPPLSDAKKNTSMLFLYSNLNLNQAIPLVPNVVEVGGLHIKKAKSLPKVCKIFLFWKYFRILLKVVKNIY